jgi:phosphohistidine swiveling domain-containing protein
MKQASEHNTDVKAEFNVIRAAVISDHEEVTSLKSVVVLNKNETLVVKEAIKRIEEEVTKFTFYKFLGYASVVSLLQIFYT